MSITSVLQKAGTWSIGFKDSMPLETMNAIDYFEHLAFIPGRVDVKGLGDQLLDMARYVGIIRNKDDVSVGGIDMSGWLGDENQKGQVIETAIILTNETFANSIRALLPDAVHEGTIHSVPGTFTDTIVYQDPRTAIDYVTSTFSSTIIEGIHVAAAPVSWRVNNDATLDAGLASDLYVTDPTAVIVTKNWGADLNLVALQGSINPTIDAKNYVTRVLLMGQGSGPSVAVGTAEAIEVDYRDMFGNPVIRTQMVSQSTTSIANVDAQAQVALNANSQPIRSLSMDTTEYDIAGDFHVGDMVWVFDPASGLYDETNPIPFRGQIIYPTKIQCIQLTIPILDGYTVAWRDKHGTWTDLSQYYQPETGSTSVEVADTYSTLLVGSSEAVQPRLTSDTMAPNPPTIGSVLTASYLAGDGQTKARFIISWATPLNPDGSDITDGAYYTVRYRVHGTSSYTYDSVGWGTNVVTIGELSNGTNYDISVQAVDTSGNQSGYDTDATYTAEADTIPPSQPAAPTVAGNPLAIQVISNLGKNTGGTFNLENDLAFIFVYASLSTGFTPGAGNFVGRIPVGNGNLSLDIPAIGSFPIANGAAMFVKITAVDASGNESTPSPQSFATALLIDTINVSNAAITNAKINDVSAAKITAGTIGAQTIILNGASSIIQSTGFTHGVTGWQIKGDGTAEFLSLSVRGTVDVGGSLESTNYAAGSTGWQISGTGAAEFNNVTVRGAVHASSGEFTGSLIGGSITAGTMTVSSSGVLESSNYVAGTTGWIVNGSGNAEFNNVTVRGILGAMKFAGATYDFTASDNSNGIRITTGSGNTRLMIGDQQNVSSYIGWNQPLGRIDFEAGPTPSNPAWWFDANVEFAGAVTFDDQIRNPGTMELVAGGLSVATFRNVSGVAETRFESLPTLSGSAIVINSGSAQLGFSSSSARFKDDIGPIPAEISGPNNPIFEANTRQFRWKPDTIERSDSSAALVQTGLIAEETAELMPNAVHYDDEHRPVSLNEIALIGYLVDAVGYLRRRIDGA